MIYFNRWILLFLSMVITAVAVSASQDNTKNSIDDDSNMGITPGKRGWQDTSSTWGKRAWQNSPSAWGKRGWQDTSSTWGKRTWQNGLQGNWGKRGWERLKPTWGKRSVNIDDQFDSDESTGGLDKRPDDWKNLKGAWGKRNVGQGWGNMRGLWGKRSWNQKGSSWGKRYDDLEDDSFGEMN